MSEHLRIRVPAVVSEVIDGEAVIMNLKSGNYYSTDKVGSQVWGWIEQGWGQRAMRDALIAMYDAAAPEIETALNAFLSDLMAQDLVEAAASGDSAAPPASPAQDGAKFVFVPPTLNVYTDMKDLLLLDPIHDVDEVGWPTPKPQQA